MKRILFFILMTASCVPVLWAQDAVSAIRKHYAEAQEMVAQYAAYEKEGEWSMPCPMYYEVNVKQNLPGTGYHKERIRLYFYEDECDEENTDGTLLSRSLHFQGNIEFAYIRNADMDHFKGGELRCYFQNGKLFKVLVSIRNQDTEKYEQKYAGATVPKEYASVYQGCQYEVDRFKRLFKEIDGETFH